MSDRSPDLTEFGAIVTELEAMRRACLARLIYRIAGNAAAVGALALSMTLFSATPDIPIALGVPCLVALLMWAYWTRRPLELFRDIFRNRFIPALAGAMGGYRYDRHGALPLIWMKRSGLIPESCLYASDHMMSGERSGIGVQFAHAELTGYGTPPAGRYGGTGPVQAFGGLFLLLSLRKALAGRTVLAPTPLRFFKMFSEPQVAWGDCVGPVLKTKRGRFEIISTEPGEARKLLTPSVVEQVTALAHALGGERIRVAFYDAQIFVMLPLRNRLFRVPSIFRRIGPPSEHAPVLSEIRTIQELADVLQRSADASR